MGKDLKGKELGEGVAQKSNGLYLARYRSLSGKRPERTFEKLQEAKRWIADQKYHERHGNIARSSNVTVDTWFDYWIESIKKPEVRTSTYENYKGRYVLDIKPYIGDILLSEVKPLHCQEVIRKGQEHLRSGTVIIARRIMRQMFKSAEENDIIAKSPLTPSVKVIRDEKAERRVLTASEQEKFTEYLQGRELSEVFLFVLETGLRVGELAGLKWDDVDLKGGKITIRQQGQWRGEYFVEEPLKTQSSYRTIPLTQRATKILAGIPRKVEDIRYHSYVFKSGGKPIRAKLLNSRLKTICKRVGIENISMHGLRHSFATRCIECGMTPKILQKIMGHSSLSMTMDLYVHATEEAMTEEIKKLDVGGLWAV